MPPVRSLDPAPLGFAGLSSPPKGGATLSGGALPLNPKHDRVFPCANIG